MRMLLYLSLGFTAGCGLCAWLLPAAYMLPGCGGAMLAALLLLAIARGSQTLKKAALVCLGCAGALLWFRQYDARYLGPIKAIDGQIYSAVIRLEDYSRETDYGRSCEGSMDIGEKTYPLIVYLDAGEELQPGWKISGEFLFRLTTPGGQRESSYHQGEGRFLLAYQRGEVLVTELPETWRDLPARLRRHVHTTLEAAFPGDAGPFAKALLLGDKEDLSYKTDTDLKTSGIAHVVAVSGLHVSILFALISTLTLKNRFLTALLGYPALLLFAAMAGFTPSVVRACLMTGLMLLSMLASREYDSGTGLAFAVLVMLLWNPMAVVSVSLQLSAGSVAGIYLFESPIRRWLLSYFGDLEGRNWKTRAATWLTSSVSVTLSAQVFTLPLSALYFGTVSLVGVVTNLLTLWIISITFYGILAVCLVFSLSGAAGSVLAKLMAWPIRYVLKMAQMMASVPLAAVYTQSVFLAGWVGFLCLLILLYIFQENKKPRQLLCCGVLSLCIALLASWMEPMFWDFRFTVLDVGQGQCLILQSQGKTYMVDCGGDSDTETADLAAETLLSQGISQLDGLILTHMDRDHAGGAAHFLSRIPTDLLILPEDAGGFEAAAKRTVVASRELELSYRDTKVKIFPPTYPGNSNEKSLCILFDTKNCDILITGDRTGFGERSLLRNADIPEVDILVAGHHGSRYSTCEELLAAVRPETVCISVSRDNTYGHPAPELLQRLETFGCAVYRTDRNGTILIRRK